MKIGANVIYKKTLKGLEKGAIGEISSIYLIGKCASVVYEQNSNTNKVYCHSANVEDLEEV